MNEIEKRIAEYVNSASTIRSDWYTFITDQQQPLDERWRTFLMAPSDWRDDVNDSDVPLEHARDTFDSPYDDFNIDRHETYEVDLIIRYLQRKVDGGHPSFTQTDVYACMEEAMENQLGSWTWDW